MKKGIQIAALSLIFWGTAQVALADNCSNSFPGSMCVDISNVANPSLCKKNYCPNTASSVQCCPNEAGVKYVTCAADGSTMYRSCTENGKVGQCNAIGVCAIPNDAISVSDNQLVTPETQAALQSQPQTSQKACGPTEFCNPLKFNTVEGLLGNFLTTLQRIIAVIALIAIIIGALMYVTSMGGKQIETAKKTITYALVGMAIAVAAPSFLKEISIILGWAPNDPSVAGAKTLTQIAMNVLNFLLAILGVIALVMLVVGGMYYTTAAGDSKQAETGKNIAKYAIFGVIVAMSAMVILQQVAKFFVN